MDCGSVLEPSDIFCGECGAVVRSSTARFGVPGDTAVIDPHLVLDAIRRDVPELAKQIPLAGSPPAACDPIPEGGPSNVGDPGPVARSARDTTPEQGLADLEATRIVGPRSDRERYVLQFSTGETVTVTGSGLIGRNPVPEPGELVEQLVRVLDPTRSVSKTHLEFGQEAGAFWVRDRYSGNGTVLREPDAPPRRCDPGKRYRLIRGSRLDIGEQFLVVS